MGIGGGLVLLRPAVAAAASAAEGFEAVAVTVQAQDADVVGQPVEQRAGEPLRAANRGPILERQVRSHHGGASLVALREGLEQQLAPTADSGTQPSSSTIGHLEKPSNCQGWLSI